MMKIPVLVSTPFLFLLAVCSPVHSSILVTLSQHNGPNGPNVMMTASGSWNTSTTPGSVQAYWEAQPRVNSSAGTLGFTEKNFNGKGWLVTPSSPHGFTGQFGHGGPFTPPYDANTDKRQNWGLFYRGDLAGQPVGYYIAFIGDRPPAVTLNCYWEFKGKTLADLGVEVGKTWEWALPNGQTALTLRTVYGVGSGQIPEPATVLVWSMLLGVGLTARRRR